MWLMSRDTNYNDTVMIAEAVGTSSLSSTEIFLTKALSPLYRVWSTCYGLTVRNIEKQKNKLVY